MSFEDMSWEELTKYQLGRRVGHWEGASEAVPRENERRPEGEEGVWPWWANRLLHGQEQLKEENERLREENRRLRERLRGAS